MQLKLKQLVLYCRIKIKSSKDNIQIGNQIIVSILLQRTFVTSEHTFDESCMLKEQVSYLKANDTLLELLFLFE